MSNRSTFKKNSTNSAIDNDANKWLPTPNRFW